MLIGLFTLIAVAVAAGLTLLCNGFTDFNWLWLMPVVFLGTFIIELVMLFVLIWIMAKCVNMEKEQEKDNKFYRFIVNQTINLIIMLLPVKIDVEGLEKRPKAKRIMLVSNHIHDIDPAIIIQYFRKYELSFISKKENEKKFLIGPFLHAILCLSINRENDREALKAILRCIDLLKKDEVSIGAFPEGYTSLDGLLHPFRPGVFKIAQRAKVPIVVCTLRGTPTVLKNTMKLKSSRVQLKILAVIEPEEYESLTAVELSDRVHKLMADDLGPDMVLQVQENT